MIKQQPMLSGFGAVGLFLMLVGAGIGAAIWMMYGINKAELYSVFLWSGFFGIPGVIIVTLEAVKAQDRSDSRR